MPIVRVQRMMRRYGLLFGTIEAGALVALLIALFRIPPGSAEMWLIGLAALCVASMMGVWAAWLRPRNRTIAKWLPEALPPDWSHHHARRSTFHRVRVMLAIIALALLLMGLFANPANGHRATAARRCTRLTRCNISRQDASPTMTGTACARVPAGCHPLGRHRFGTVPCPASRLSP